MKHNLRIIVLAGILAGGSVLAERPNVVVVLTDDQGYDDLSCHGNVADLFKANGYATGHFGKGQYYDGGHRAPCFIRWPKGHLGVPRDIGELQQMQDIFPTLIDLCHLKNSARFDGTSLAGLLTGKASKRGDRKLVVQWSPKDYPDYGRAAVLWNTWRWVHDQELYNIATDPSQENAVFELALPAGETEMNTWLLDEHGEELCGAFYVEAMRLK